MCGISGYLDFEKATSADNLKQIAQRMTDALRHRGPDADGHWADAAAGVALGHRRLAIIDLSDNGAQPMHDAYGRYVITYNGELYNYRDLRGQLGDYPFRGESDTEVMLAAFHRWGIPEALERFNGMFAFGLWDTEARQLTIARDRLGEKPLYYSWQGDKFYFLSQMSSYFSLLSHQAAFARLIDRNALAAYLQYSYIPSPYSIFEGIFKLPPAHYLTVGPQPSEPSAYWSLQAVADAGAQKPNHASDADLIAEFDALLRDAVRLQMVADVPLGAFLSGGVDSSTIVALMQAQSARPIKTFTIGFHDGVHNEAEHAKAVAQHLGTDHTELYLSQQDLLDIIPQLPTFYDEPFGDSSQIPTYCVSQLARQSVTVSLSGDGGDEVFGGYNRYLWAPRIWSRVEGLPPAIRQGIGAGLQSLSPRMWNRLPLPINNAGEKAHKLAIALGASNPYALYERLASQWQAPTSIVKNAALLEKKQLSQQDFTAWMMLMDAATYLPGDILTKVDRAAMAVSLETRIPFLDYRVVEAAWRLPLNARIRAGRGKWLLRQVLYQYVPHTLIERPKTGFSVPLEYWLRYELRDWAESLLNEQLLQDYFDPAPIRQKWREHLSGQRDWHHALWPVLMFQAWRQAWL